jgi:hypothetical protein
MKEEWLFSNAVVPVDVETTAALVAEIKRLIDVVGGMVLKQALAAPDLQAELDATNRQVEILSDALAESRREVASLKANAALDKKAENARELGLDYEPAKYSDIVSDGGMDPRNQFDVPPAAQRQWVGLTDEELNNFLKAVWGREVTPKHFIQAIEAKLKEKNTAAQPAVPDAFGTREGEHPQYIQGWNDCRAEMLKGMK